MEQKYSVYFGLGCEYNNLSIEEALKISDELLPYYKKVTIVINK